MKKNLSVINLCLLSLLLLLCGPIDARPLTLQETVTLQQVNQVAVSQDGKLTAFTRVVPRQPYTEDDGTSYIELYLLNADGQEQRFVTGKQRVAQVQFAHQDRFLYFLSKRDADKFTSLYRIAISGGEAIKVYEHSTDIQSYAVSDDGKVLAFRARPAKSSSETQLEKKGFRAEIFEENLTATQLLTLSLTEPGAKPQLLAVTQHILSLQFQPASYNILVRAAPTPLVDDDLMRSQYQLLSHSGELLQAFNTEGKLDQAEFSPDGKQLAFIGAQDKHDPSAGLLYLAEVKNGQIRELLPNYAGHVQSISWRSNTELLYVGHLGVEAEIGSIAIRSGKVSQLVKPGSGIISRIVWPANQSEGRVLLNKAEHPAEVYTLTQRGRLSRLTDSNPLLKDITQPRQELFRHQARDGLALEGVLVYPLNYQPEQRYPLIMVVHGGPEAHISNGWNNRYGSPVNYSAAQGYMVFFPNYRGSTGRGVDFSKLGQNDYAGKEFDDIVDAKNALVAAGLVDEKKVGITGGSYGGYASAWGATAQTEHFAASVMFVGISNNLSKFGTTDIANEMHLVHARSYPWEKWQWYLERSPIYYAEQARTPILIMHGKNDTRVHPSQSMELYRYLKTLGKVPVRLVLYPGEGHGNTRSASQLDYAMRLMQWLDHFLLQGGTELPAADLPHAEQLKTPEKPAA